MDKNNKGLIYTIVGILCTSLGLFLFVNQQAVWAFLSSFVVGVLFALYGLIKIVRDYRNNISD